MRKKPLFVALVASSLVLSSCATYQQGGGPNQNEVGAGLLGAISCALIVGGASHRNRAENAAIAAGVCGLIGAGIGRYLDQREKHELAEASYRAAAQGHVGERTDWGPQIQQRLPTSSSNPGTPTSHPQASPPGGYSVAQSTGASGWVIPQDNPYQTASGQTCRDLKQVANKDGKTYSQRVKACKTANGWTLSKT